MEFREVYVKLLLACSLILASTIPILGTDEKTESLKSAWEMLKDPSLHIQSLYRISRVYSFVADVPESELKHLLSEISAATEVGVSERVRKELQVAILQRLTTHDPIEALKFAVAREDSENELFIRTVLEAWAINDLESAIAGASDLSEQARTLAMFGLLDAQDEADVRLALDLGRDLNLSEENALAVCVEWFNADSAPDPKNTWLDFAELSKSYRTMEILELLERLAIQRYLLIGVSAISEVRDLAGKDYSLQKSFGAVLKYIAMEDPKFALDYLLKLPSRDYVLEDALMRIWAETDLQGALEATYAIVDDSLRKDLQGEVASVWAKKEPRFVLQNLDLIPEPVRFVAARVGVQEIAESSLQEAGEYAMSIDDQALRTDAVSWLIPIWSRFEPSTMLDWLLDDPANEPIVEENRQQLIYNILDYNPRRAFQLAKGQSSDDWDRGTHELLAQMRPETRHRLPPPVGQEAHIMKEIAESDTQLALELFPDVREGTTKFEAALHVGSALVYLGSVQDAFDLAEQLPEPDRDRYYARLVNEWTREDPISLMESIEELPTLGLQSFAAARLLRLDRQQNTLDEFQVTSLRKYLSETDRIRVDWH